LIGDGRFAFLMRLPADQTVGVFDHHHVVLLQHEHVATENSMRQANSLSCETLDRTAAG
jgi:hypothetical protein